VFVVVFPFGALLSAHLEEQAQPGTPAMVVSAGEIQADDAAPAADDNGAPAFRDILKSASRIVPPAKSGDEVEAAPAAGESSRTWLLPALYLTYGALQAADVYTTHRALEQGGAREANPMLRWAAASPSALIGVKAASTAGTIYLLEKLRRRHPRAAAITMVALNASYAAIVAHNMRVRSAAAP
jgi:hypothetical protein